MLICRDGACFHAERSIAGKARNEIVLHYLTILTLLSDCVIEYCLVSFAAISLL